MARVYGTGRMYTVVLNASISATPRALFNVLESGTRGRLRLRRLRLVQTSEGVSDDTVVTVSITRGYSSGGAPGSVTPRPLNSGDPALAHELQANASQMGGTPTVLFEDAWNMREPYDMPFAPDEAPEMGSRDLAIVLTSPSDAYTVRATAWLENTGY